MENLGLLIIFWYGVLHAFGPDHLTAIADFSIGKSKRKTLAITVAFAVGHGVMLFIFAKVLEHFSLSESLLGYGDLISSLVIIGMGLFLLYMSVTNRIQLKVHEHEGKEHIHIWYGSQHTHSDKVAASAFTIGALMGIGGVRGMLVTLGLIEGERVDLMMIVMFVLGVTVVFLALGLIMLYINQKLLYSIDNIRKVFATIGFISVIVGANMLLTPHAHAVLVEPDLQGKSAHPHPHQDKAFKNVDELVASKQQSQMSYKEMMQHMGEAFSMIQRGVLSQNAGLVQTGAQMIDNHPAPKEKPWSIVKKEHREAFKGTLLAYNDLLHQGAKNIEKAVGQGDWVEINKRAYELSNHCISCHSVWKNKVSN
jgi:ABC-type nickel/cobalt efflux system permease component RcnA